MARNRYDGPVSVSPVALNLEFAAEYLSISKSNFSKLVREGKIKKPVILGGRQLWPVSHLRESFELLTSGEMVDEVEL